MRTYRLTHIALAVRDAERAFRLRQQVFSVSSRVGRLLALLAAAIAAGSASVDAQTVIHDSAPPPPLADTAARPAKADTATRPPAAPAPAVAPVPDPYPKGVCTEESAGSQAPDVLLVTFKPGTSQAERNATIKSVKGSLIAPDPSDDRSWFVRVPGEGNEFLLRAIADRLIRARPVNEVGPIPCPARP